LENKIFAIFPGNNQEQLAKLCTNFLADQKRTWSGLAAAHQELANAQTRLMSCGGYDVSVQFNPARIVSSGAAVDRESIQNRPCFLCSDNLPPGQKAILYQDEYLVLCNPAPIFTEHFTIVHRQHQPQAIAQAANMFLDMTKDMSPYFALLYNGPACGASAPDHLHFQAVPADTLPLLQAFAGHFRVIRDADIKIYQAKNIDRAALVLEGRDKNLLLAQFSRLLNVMQKINSANDEPKINLLCAYVDGVWRLMIFLRTKLRPDAFYQEGEQRVLISLGTIDMAGVIITPLKLDFDRLDCGKISDIYREVSLTEEMMNKIINEL
jgi:hypothetical protein